MHDLGSTNGTSVNGSNVQTWQLADGDVIRVGHSTVVFNLHQVTNLTTDRHAGASPPADQSGIPDPALALRAGCGPGGAGRSAGRLGSCAPTVLRARSGAATTPGQPAPLSGHLADVPAILVVTAGSLAGTRLPPRLGPDPDRSRGRLHAGARRRLRVHPACPDRAAGPRLCGRRSGIHQRHLSGPGSDHRPHAGTGGCAHPDRPHGPGVAPMNAAYSLLEPAGCADDPCTAVRRTHRSRPVAREQPGFGVRRRPTAGHRRRHGWSRRRVTSPHGWSSPHSSTWTSYRSAATWCGR